MRLFLDDRPLEAEDTTLAAALDAARAKAEAGGRIIVEVLADGAPAPESDLQDPSGVTRRPYAGEVRFVSETPRGLVAGALRDASQAIAMVQDKQREAAEQIHRGDAESSVALLGDAVTLWQMVRRALDESGRILGMALEGDRGIAPLAEELAGRLTAIRAALASQDWAALADELDDEMDAHAERWRGALVDLAARVSSEQ